jgi:tetratricopeptide (TPR) repeat protein/GGDEF domain-containing protein
MAFNSIDLTPADAVAHKEIFQREMADLLGSRQLAILPPFPDYSLLSQHRSPKVLLKLVNEAVLSRRPAFNQEFSWLLLPLVQGEKVVGVLFAEDVEKKYQNPENQVLLERLARLCIDSLQWEKRGWRDEETMLWRRQVLIKELSRAIELAESDGSLTSRRMLDHRPGAAQFSFICFAVTPAPEPWAGPGPVWQHLGPKVVEAMPKEALAAHLGGGYVGIFWPKAQVVEAQQWAEGVASGLKKVETESKDGEEKWTLRAGIASFPEDFYDDGPSLPWEKSDHGVRLTATEEVIRRAALAAHVAKHKDQSILSYQTLLEQGLVKRESAIEKGLSPLLTNDEPGALLLIKLDDWEIWQRQHGSRGAAGKARRVMAVSKEESPATAVVEWAGPDRFGMFLPGADVDSAQEGGRAIRQLVKSELGTTVQIGISVHPCPGFAKVEMLDNARKALIHTGFFGPNTQTLFDAVSLNISGDRLYERGKLEEAVEEFQRALTLDPNNVNVSNSLGVCYAQMGEFEQAVTEFARVTSLKPSDFMGQYNLACALLSLGREDEAEQAFTRASKLEPKRAAPYFQLAKLCRKQNRLEEALNYLGQTVELKPHWAKAWRLFGECFLEQGKDAEAMNGFKKALKINGNEAAALSGLGILYGRVESNLEIALSLARRSVDLEPDSALFCRRLAELLWQNREPEEALAHCRRAAAIAPDDQQVRQLQKKITAAQRVSTS